MSSVDGSRGGEHSACSKRSDALRQQEKCAEMRCAQAISARQCASFVADVVLCVEAPHRMSTKREVAMRHSAQ